MREVFASLYNDRAISYRVHKGFAHADVALSAGVQRMVRSDLGAAGVMFTIDTESGFKDVVFVTSSYGLGETVVQGAVNPDEFYVHKPALRAGKLPIIRRNLGSKLLKMEFTSADEKAASGKLVKTSETAPEQRNRYLMSRSIPREGKIAQPRAECHAVDAYLAAPTFRGTEPAKTPTTNPGGFDERRIRRSQEDDPSFAAWRWGARRRLEPAFLQLRGSIWPHLPLLATRQVANRGARLAQRRDDRRSGTGWQASGS